MPIYQYKCPENHFVEMKVKVGEDSKTFPCKSCGNQMKRVYNTFGIRLKGSGFYKNS